jgi:hypothetical protein
MSHAVKRGLHKSVLSMHSWQISPPHRPADKDPLLSLYRLQASDVANGL